MRYEFYCRDFDKMQTYSSLKYALKIFKRDELVITSCPLYDYFVNPFKFWPFFPDTGSFSDELAAD